MVYSNDDGYFTILTHNVKSKIHLLLTTRRRYHQNYLVPLPKQGLHAVELADLLAVHEDVEMSAKPAFGIHQMEFCGRELPDQKIDQFRNGRGRNRDLALVIEIILHCRGKTDNRHGAILLRVSGDCPESRVSKIVGPRNP